MNFETVFTFSLVAGVAIVSPGPAIVLAIRNGAAFGMRAVVWSSLGNVCGIFLLSTAANLGLGVLLMSSATLFTLVKLFGAMYLFYLGARHLIGRTSALVVPGGPSHGQAPPEPMRLFREALFLSTTNPKPILFFTALFPQFVSAQEPLLAQFLTLTGIFMALSFSTLMGYALLASRARNLLLKPVIVAWFNRAFGLVFVSFGAALLAMRRSAP